MKKLLLLLLIIPLTSFNSSYQTTDLVGKWIGEENGEIGFIIFTKDGYASFEIDGKVLGGKEFTINGEKGKMTYKINSDTNPTEIDFTLIKLQTGEQKQLLCIARFIDKNSMEFAISFDAERPLNFDENNSIILKRVK